MHLQSTKYGTGWWKFMEQGLYQYALRATVYATTQYFPAQLVFGRDSIINQHHHVD